MLGILLLKQKKTRYFNNDAKNTRDFINVTKILDILLIKLKILDILLNESKYTRYHTKYCYKCHI